MIKDRIKELRQSLSMTQQEFAGRLGIKRNTIAKYETGLNNPTDAVLSLICKTWNINSEWLKTGNGEMYIDNPDDVIGEYARANGLSEEDAIFLKDFASLSPDQRKAVIAFTLKVADDIRKRSEHYTESDYEKDLGITEKEESTTSNISEDESESLNETA